MFGLIQWAVRETMPRWHDGTAEQAENARQGFQQMKALHALDDDLVQEQLVTDLRAAGWVRTRVVFKHNLGGYPYPFIEVAS